MIVCIAALLLIKPRIGREEGMLFGGLLGIALDVQWQFYAADWRMWAGAALANAAIGCAIAQLIRYALAHVAERRFVRAANAGALVLGALVAVAGFVPVYLAFGTDLDQDAYVRVASVLARLRWALFLAGVVSIEGAAIAAYRRAAEASRSRLLLIVIGFAPLVLTSGVHGLVVLVRGSDLAWAGEADAAGNVLTALVLTYGAASRKLIDIEYAINAALAFTITGAVLTLAAFAAEHFAAPKLEAFITDHLVPEKFAETVHEGIGIVVAFLAFLSIDKLHERVAELLRDAIFRHRGEHIAALREFAEDVGEGKPGEIAQRLVDATIEHAGASAAALYVRRGATFNRLAAEGDLPVVIEATDPRVPPLRKPQAPDDGTLSLPMPAGRHLSGFLYCGRKRSATAYAPDETSLLALAARETGLALRLV